MNLVERLRTDAWHPDDVRTMAADEIERLQAENTKLREALQKIYDSGFGNTRALQL